MVTEGPIVNSRLSRLALGSVQFGLDYGITNAMGMVNPREARRIVEYAAELGVRVIDTAAAYGRSEEVLGTFADTIPDLRIVTKAPPLSAASFTVDDGRQLANHFRQQLKRLKVSQVHGYIMHRHGDLLKPGAEHLWDELRALQREGLVAKLGVSVYSPSDALEVMQRYDVELIQGPLNVLDQRLAGEAFCHAIESRGIELHSRSAFLQGTLLAPPDMLPPALVANAQLFARFANACAKQGISPIEACLDFCLRARHVAAVVVGVCSLGQVEEVIRAIQNQRGLDDYEAFSTDLECVINPALWPRP